MVATKKSGETLETTNPAKVQFSLRWKIALVFSILFSTAFLLTLEAVTYGVTREADRQIKIDLTQALEGAASGVDVDMLTSLAENGEANAQGFSDDRRYLALMEWLDTIHTAEPDAWPYLYVPADKEGHIRFVVDLYANYDDQASSKFLELYKSNSGFILVGLREKTYRAVDAPLVETLKNWSNSIEGWNEAKNSWIAAGLMRLANWIADTGIAPQRDFGTYEDQYGRWASGYMPLVNASGEKVAGIGVDFQANMINNIRRQVRSSIWRTFLVSYFVLLTIFIFTSYKITKPIISLTDIAIEIGKNNQRLVLSQPKSKKKKDEIDLLGSALVDTYSKLQNANDQLKELSHQLISDREQYRKELARNLHDNVLSYLSVLTTNQQNVFDEKTMRENYQQVINRLRNTIFALRSPMMEYGLSIAIEDYLDSFEDCNVHEGYQIFFDIPDSEARFDNTIETHLFRIVQQALENAIKHSKATKIIIRGEITDERVDISIEDNGTGIFKEDYPELNLEKFKLNKKYGIVGMIERAGLIGATLTVKANTNGGTILEVDWQPQTAKKAAN